MKENVPTSSLKTPVGRGLRTRRKPKASDTPETDAHSPASYAIIRPDGVRTDYVPADFARKLERERDAARKIAEFAMLEADRLRPRHSTH
jgi:hypothetical protein